MRARTCRRAAGNPVRGKAADKRAAHSLLLAFAQDLFIGHVERLAASHWRIFNERLVSACTLATLTERRRAILQPLAAKRRGRIVNIMGDGVIVEFGSAVNAVACCREGGRRRLPHPRGPLAKRERCWRPRRACDKLALVASE